MTASFARALARGDRRSIGDADAVAAALRAEPSRFEELWLCLTHDDPVVRMRAADALEKFGRSMPGAFEPRRKALLEREVDDGTCEVRWHLIALASRLFLNGDEAEAYCEYLEDRLRHDLSKIVKVAALQAAFDIASRHAGCAARVRAMLDYARASRWPSVRARAAKLTRASNAA